MLDSLLTLHHTPGTRLVFFLFVTLVHGTIMYVVAHTVSLPLPYEQILPVLSEYLRPSFLLPSSHCFSFSFVCTTTLASILALYDSFSTSRGHHLFMSFCLFNILHWFSFTLGIKFNILTKASVELILPLSAVCAIVTMATGLSVTLTYQACLPSGPLHVLWLLTG